MERQIRDLLERYYRQFGLTFEEAKRLPIQQLLEKLNNYLEGNKNGVAYYASVVTHLDEKIQVLTINAEELKYRMKDLQGENKGLHGELAELRKENYGLKLQNSMYKQRGIDLNLSQDKTQSLEQNKVADISLAR